MNDAGVGGFLGMKRAGSETAVEQHATISETPEKSEYHRQ